MAGLNKKQRLSYGKRKVRQMNTAAKSKCMIALDLSEDALDTEAESCEHCNDLNRLIILLKEKVKNAPRREKIKLLTLVPESWTIKKTKHEFQVTEHLVKQARQLKKEKGILADQDPKKGRPLPQEIVQRVTDFYQSDDFSRTAVFTTVH